MLAEQIASHKWVYVLDYQKQSDLQSTAYRVCVAVENQPGIFEASSGDNQWYSDQENIEELNRKRGYQPCEADRILASSRASNSLS